MSMKLIVNMKKGLRRLTCFVGVLCMLLTMFTFLAVPAMADATRVVTLGQDLSDEQEAFIVNYFGVDLSTARVIYVNNWQEREILGSWIPLEQIGNITISSAYVQPTNSGGIQVRTANLTYVTGNMIASVLSTAGITNCNVVAAAPFPVSGTGALTGVMIAYQAATGEELDNTKRDLAVQEFTVTQQASGSIGEDEALQLVNAVKMEVLQSGVSAEDTQQITEIVDQVVSDMDQSMAVNGNQIDTLNMDQSVNVDNSTFYDYSVNTISNGLSADDRQMLIDLAARIAEQDYDTDAIMETLERVNDNLADKTNIEINVSNGNTIDNSNSVANDSTNTNNSSSDTEVSADDEDSIFNTLNVEELSADVQSATDTAGMAQIEEQMQEEAIEAKQAAAPDTGFSIMNEETFVLGSDQAGTQQQEQQQMPVATETVVPEQQEQQMPDYTETIVPEPQQEQQPEQPQMPDYTETVVPEPQQEQQPEQQQMPDYTETVVPEPSETAADQWKVAKIPAGQTMRADVQEVWDTMESTVYEGVELTPAVYLGSQTVSGLNYAILCTGVPAEAEGEDAEEALYMVIMYEPLEGAASITHMTKIDLDALAGKQTVEEAGEPVLGGWEFSRAAQDVPTSMEQVTASVFSALAGTYPEKDLTPVMLLGTKQTDITEYAVLCYEIPEGAESGFYEVAFATGDQFGYITDSKLVPLNLADYNS